MRSAELEQVSAPDAIVERRSSTTRRFWIKTGGRQALEKREVQTDGCRLSRFGAFVINSRTSSQAPYVMFPPGNMWRAGNGAVMWMLLNRHVDRDVCEGFTNCLPYLTAHSIEDCNQNHSAR